MILADGSLWTFGMNNRGQLGDGNNTNRLIPVKVVDENVTQVATGSSHTILLKQDGSVWTMGRNDAGMLGDGTQIDRNVPVRVIEENATGVACGSYHSFVLMQDGSLLAFGSNGSYRTGLIQHKANALSPQVVFSSGVQAVAGGDAHSLFLKTDGSLWAPDQILMDGLAPVSWGQAFNLPKLLSLEWRVFPLEKIIQFTGQPMERFMFLAPISLGNLAYLVGHYLPTKKRSFTTRTSKTCSGRIFFRLSTLRLTDFVNLIV